MKRPEIARKIARRAGLSEGEAADRLDSVVSDILANLRKGKAADLPGLGRFHRGANGAIRFEREESGRE